MDIVEATLEDVKEQGKIEGEKIGELKTKIKGIQKALAQKLLSLEQIADLFEVELSFVYKVQHGEII